MEWNYEWREHEIKLKKNEMAWQGEMGLGNEKCCSNHMRRKEKPEDSKFSIIKYTVYQVHGLEEDDLYLYLVFLW